MAFVSLTEQVDTSTPGAAATPGGVPGPHLGSDPDHSGSRRRQPGAPGWMGEVMYVLDRRLLVERARHHAAGLLRRSKGGPFAPVAVFLVVLLTGGVGLAALVRPAAAPGVIATGSHAGQSSPSAAGNWVRDLSTGAPPGALTLASYPRLGTAAAPADAATISGLATNGIPSVALNAYRVAAARIDSALAGCGIDWSLIAAIGRVESNHGQFGGAVLNADGTSTPPIIGPALTGTAFAYIRDTDRGVLDGDTSYDRAIGPMQFIPSTWHSYAVDGNSDGSTSPFDINDAALAAAHYLCVAGGDLTTDAGQRRAVLAYNHSDQYLAEVLALAHAYATGVPVAGVPLVGSTSGPVPAPTGNYRAPAAPGPAPAAAEPSNGSTSGGAAQAAPAPTSTSATRANTAGGGTAASQTTTAPAPPGPAAAPPAAPAPAAPAAPVPAAPVLPQPGPLPVPLPSPSPTLIPGLTCGLPNLPVC